MMRRTHTAVGLASGFGLAHLQHDPLALGIALALATQIAAVLPDQDLRIGLKHRGVTHSLLALLLIVGVARYIYPRLALPIAVGYSSHLILDMLTIWGIPVLWPVQKRFRLARFSTGGGFDQLLAIMASCGAILAIYLMLKVTVAGGALNRGF